MTFAPLVGTNGRLYFNYNPGARIKMIDDRGEQYELEILNCQYVNEKEYYQVARDRQPMLGRMSVNRLTYLLNHNQIETLALGTPCELPLTNKEVKLYAGYMKRKRKNDVQLVEKQLEDVGYNELNSKLTSLILHKNKKGIQYIGEAEDTVKEMTEIERQMSQIVIDNDIDIGLLSRKPCPRCNDSGFYGENEDNGICKCMRDKQAEIKALCALWRS